MISLAYFVWPIALYVGADPRRDASAWFRYHLRQALWFGVISGIVALFAFFWPLALSFLVANSTAVIWIYAIAMILDVALFVLWLVLAMRYSQRAARGELFEIPWVARLTGTRISK